MDVFTPSDRVHLPQSVVSIKPVNGLEYTGTSTSNPVVEFIIPATTGFINASDTVLNFEFSYTGDVANLRPQQNMGLAGMIEQIDIFNLQGVLLEQIMNYDVLQAVLYSHDVGCDSEKQDGTFNVRAETECYCMNNQNPQPFVTPAVNPITPQDPNGNPSYQTQKIQLPIRLSALIGSGGVANDRVVPIAALGGLRIRFTMTPVANFTIADSDDILDLVETPNWFYAAPDIPDGATAELFRLVAYYNSTVDDNGGSTDPTTWSNVANGVYTLNTLTTALNNELANLGIGITIASTFTAPSLYSFTANNTTASDITLSGNFWANFTTLGSGTTVAAGATVTFTPNADNNAIANDIRYIPLEWKTPTLCNPDSLNSQPFLKNTKLKIRANDGTYWNIPGALTDIGAFSIIDVYKDIGNDYAGSLVEPSNWQPSSQEIRLTFDGSNPFNNWTAGDARIFNGSITSGNGITTVKTILPTNTGYTLKNVSLDCTVCTPPLLISKV